MTSVGTCQDRTGIHISRQHIRSRARIGGLAWQGEALGNGDDECSVGCAQPTESETDPTGWVTTIPSSPRRLLLLDRRSGRQAGRITGASDSIQLGLSIRLCSRSMGGLSYYSPAVSQGALKKDAAAAGDTPPHHPVLLKPSHGHAAPPVD